jgi:hypothetical protein
VRFAGKGRSRCKKRPRPAVEAGCPSMQTISPREMVMTWDGKKNAVFSYARRR